MNGAEADWLLGLEALADAFLAAILGVVWLFASKILKALNQRVERRIPPAATVAPGTTPGGKL
jgi:hypothetical protein